MTARSRSRLEQSSLRSAHSWLSLCTLVLTLAVFGCTREQPEVAPADPGRLEPPVAVDSTLEQSQPRGMLAALRPETEAAPAVNSTSKLPIYELKIGAKDLQKLEKSVFSNETVPATFTAGGVSYEKVRVRYRGAWARSWPKKPLKIFFDKEQPFEGQRRLNLNSGWRDPALVRECLAYHVYAACGAPASRARVVRLHLNGRFHGLYIEVEQPDQAFVKARGLKGASVYKANSRANQADERDLGSEASYRRHYEKQTKKTEGYNDLQEFCRELAQTTDVLEFFTRRVDLEKYINYLAATVLTQNWDGFNKNHYLIFDGEGSGKWLAAPWDLDRTLGDHWNWSFDEAHLPVLLGTRQLPGVTGWNRLQDRFFSHPELRARLLDRLEVLLRDEFTPEKLFPILDRFEAEIGSDAALDRQRWPGPRADLRRGMQELKRFIESRRTYLLGATAELRRETARASVGR